MHVRMCCVWRVHVHASFPQREQVRTGNWMAGELVGRGGGGCEECVTIHLHGISPSAQRIRGRTAARGAAAEGNRARGDFLREEERRREALHLQRGSDAWHLREPCPKRYCT